MTDPKVSTLTDEEAEKMARAHYEVRQRQGYVWAWDTLSRDNQLQYMQAARAAWAASPGPGVGGGSPIPMVLNCPACGLQHVDAPETVDAPAYGVHGGVIGQRSYATWTNPPHRSHLCHRCGFIWRPADVPTEGVQAIQTKGKNDRPWPPLDTSAPPFPSLPPDVKAAVETVEIIARWFPGQNGRDAIATLLASHTALTEANGRMREKLAEVTDSLSRRVAIANPSDQPAPSSLKLSGRGTMCSCKRRPCLCGFVCEAAPTPKDPA